MKNAPIKPAFRQHRNALTRCQPAIKQLLWNRSSLHQPSNIADPGCGGYACVKRSIVIDKRQIPPFMNFSMAVGKREPASVIMISGRLVHPIDGIRTEPAVIDAPGVFIQHDPAIGRSDDEKIRLFPEYPVTLIKWRSARDDFVNNRSHISVHGHATNSRCIRSSRWHRLSEIRCSLIRWTLEYVHALDVRVDQTKSQQLGICRRRRLLHIPINPLVFGISRVCIRIGQKTNLNR